MRTGGLDSSHFQNYLAITRPPRRFSTTAPKRADLLLLIIFQETELGPNFFQNRENRFVVLYSLLGSVRVVTC